MGDLRIPDFSQIAEIVEKVFKAVEPNTGGDNADYIPQLAEVDPDQFAISITSVDGQTFSVGDATKQFCIQSCSKPISYLIALNEHGQDYVHNHVGTEPSGHKFNEMCLKPAPTEDNGDREIPHNPCINAGAIMSCSMVKSNLATRPERLDSVMDVWRALSGGKVEKGSKEDPIGYDDAT